MSAFLLYCLLAWFLPKLVNKDIYQMQIRDWLEGSLNETSPVSIDHIDLALRLNGRSDLYIHEPEFASPTPFFALPWLSIDNIRASAQVYDLWGGLEASPVIQLRDAILNLQWDKNGRSNLDGLEISKKDLTPPILSNIDITKCTFELMKNRIFLDHPQLGFNLRFNGQLSFKDNLTNFKAAPFSNNFYVTHEGGKARIRSQVHLKSLSCDLATEKFAAVNLNVDNLPLRIINLISTNLPLIPPTATVSGTLSTDADNLIFSGSISGIDLPPLPSTGDLKLTFKNPTLRDYEGVALVISDDQNTLLGFESNVQKDKSWGPASFYFAAFDIDHLLSGTNPEWLKYLCKIFPAAKINAGAAKISDFDIGSVELNIVPSKNGFANISLDGNIAGGKLSLIARNTPLSEKKLPESVLAILDIPDAGDTLLRFNKAIPKILSCSPTDGNGQIAVTYDPKRSQEESDTVFSLQLNLKDVIIPTLSGGKAIQELAALTRGLQQLAALCQQAKGTEGDKVIINPQGLSRLRFSSLQVMYEVISGNKGKINGLLAKSPDIGDISASGGYTENGLFRITFHISNIPEKILHNAGLSPDIRKALNTVVKRDGLRILCTDDEYTSQVDNLYIQDIFKEWLADQSK